MAERNDDLAYQTLDYIREHPQEWDQKNYFCGTTACFAGRAIILNAENTRTSWRSVHTIADPGGVAARLLGWSWAEAQYVFGFFTRDFDVLEGRVKEVLNGEIGEGALEPCPSDLVEQTRDLLGILHEYV